MFSNIKRILSFAIILGFKMLAVAFVCVNARAADGNNYSRDPKKIMTGWCEKIKTDFSSCGVSAKDPVGCKISEYLTLNESLQKCLGDYKVEETIEKIKENNITCTEEEKSDVNLYNQNIESSVIKDLVTKLAVCSGKSYENVVAGSTDGAVEIPYGKDDNYILKLSTTEINCSAIKTKLGDDKFKDFLIRAKNDFYVAKNLDCFKGKLVINYAAICNKLERNYQINRTEMALAIEGIKSACAESKTHDAEWKQNLANDNEFVIRLINDFITASNTSKDSKSQTSTWQSEIKDYCDKDDESSYSNNINELNDVLTKNISARNYIDKNLQGFYDKHSCSYKTSGDNNADNKEICDRLKKEDLSNRALMGFTVAVIKKACAESKTHDAEWKQNLANDDAFVIELINDFINESNSSKDSKSQTPIWQSATKDYCELDDATNYSNDINELDNVLTKNISARNYIDKNLQAFYNKHSCPSETAVATCTSDEQIAVNTYNNGLNELISGITSKGCSTPKDNEGNYNLSYDDTVLQVPKATSDCSARKKSISQSEASFINLLLADMGTLTKAKMLKCGADKKLTTGETERLSNAKNKCGTADLKQRVEAHNQRKEEEFEKIKNAGCSIPKENNGFFEVKYKASGNNKAEYLPVINCEKKYYFSLEDSLEKAENILDFVRTLQCEDMGSDQKGLVSGKSNNVASVANNKDNNVTDNSLLLKKKKNVRLS